MLRLLPKAAAPVLIRLLLLAFLSCRLLPFLSSSSSPGVGGSGRSSSELVSVQSRLYPERNVVRFVAPVAVAAVPAALLSSSPAEALPAMLLLLRGVGGLPFRTALPLAPEPCGVLAVGRGALALPQLLIVDRGVGGLPPPEDFDGPAFFLLVVALFTIPVALAVVLLTGFGGSPPRLGLPLLLVVEVLTLVGLVQSASAIAVEVVATLLLFALIASGCSGSFSVSFVIASGASSSEPGPLLLVLQVAPSSPPSPPSFWLDTLASVPAFCDPSACVPRTSSDAAASSMFSLVETLIEGVVLCCFCLLAIATVGSAF